MKEASSSASFMVTDKSLFMVMTIYTTPAGTGGGDDVYRNIKVVR